MGKTRILTESAVILALYIVLLLMSMYVPLLGTLALFMLALPFVIFTARRGWQSGILLVVAASLLTIIFGTLLSIPTTILFGTSGVVIGYLYKLHKSRYEILTIGSIAFLVNLLIVYGIVTTIFNFNLLEEAKNTTNQIVIMTREMMTQMGQTVTEQQLEQFEQMFEMVPLMIPTVMVILSVLLAFLTQLISVPILKRFGFKINNWAPFKELRLPKSLVWYYLIVMILMMTPLDKDSVIYLGVINLFVILEVLMVLQGLSFIFFYSYHKNLSKGIPITILILSFFLPFLLYIVRIIGIIDLGFNLRQYVSKK